MERKPRKDGTVVKRVDLRVAGTLVRKVPLRLRNVHERYRSYSSTKPEFEYAIDIDEPARVSVSHADPTECCKLAQAALEKELAIDWQPVLLVTVEGLEYGFREDRAERKPDEAELKIMVREYEVGTRGQEAVYRTKEHARNTHGYVQTGELIDPSANRAGLASAVVPATDVNRAKLAAIVTAVHDVRDRVAALLRPETVEKTLSDLRVLALPVSVAAPQVKTPRKPKVKPGKVKRL